MALLNSAKGRGIVINAQTDMEAEAPATISPPRPFVRRRPVIFLALLLLPLSASIALWIVSAAELSLLWAIPLQGFVGALLTMAVVLARYGMRR